MRETNSMRLPKNRLTLAVIVAFGLVGSALITEASRSADDLEPVPGKAQAAKGLAKDRPPPPPKPGSRPAATGRLTETQVAALQAALEERPPDAVKRVIQKVNRTKASRIAYTDLIRRALRDAIKEWKLAELQNLPSPEDVPARQVVEALTEGQVEKILRDRLSRLTGTRPPPNLRHQILKQNALAEAVLQKVAPGLQLSPGQRVPSPSLPALDWRDKGWVVQDSGIVTAVQDQSTPVSCGCCWAFATIGTLEAAYAKNNRLLIGASEQYLLNCAGDALRSTINTPWDCFGGWWAFDMLMVNNGGLVDVPGAPNRSDLPYTGVQSPCQDGLDRPFKVLAWGYVGSGGPSDVPTDEQLKQALCKYGPVAVAVKADELTWIGNRGDVIQDFANDPSANVNHAIVLVGWDNSMSTWIIKNSWGPWGMEDSGFGYVRYGCNNIGWGAAWVIPVRPD
jgi:hypothetical protein